MLVHPVGLMLFIRVGLPPRRLLIPEYARALLQVQTLIDGRQAVSHAEQPPVIFSNRAEIAVGVGILHGHWGDQVAEQRGDVLVGRGIGEIGVPGGGDVEGEQQVQLVVQPGQAQHRHEVTVSEGSQHEDLLGALLPQVLDHSGCVPIVVFIRAEREHFQVVGAFQLLAEFVLALLPAAAVELVIGLPSLPLQVGRVGLLLSCAVGQCSVAAVDLEVGGLLVAPVRVLRPLLLWRLGAVLERFGVHLAEHIHEGVPSVLTLHFLQYFSVVDLTHSRKAFYLSVHDDSPRLHALDAGPNGGLLQGVLLLIEDLLGLEVVEAEGALLGLLADPEGNYLFALLSYHYNRLFSNVWKWGPSNIIEYSKNAKSNPHNIEAQPRRAQLRALQAGLLAGRAVPVLQPEGHPPRVHLAVQVLPLQPRPLPDPAAQ